MLKEINVEWEKKRDIYIKENKGQKTYKPGCEVRIEIQKETRGVKINHTRK